MYEHILLAQFYVVVCVEDKQLYLCTSSINRLQTSARKAQAIFVIKTKDWISYYTKNLSLRQVSNHLIPMIVYPTLNSSMLAI